MCSVKEMLRSKLILCRRIRACAQSPQVHSGARSKKHSGQRGDKSRLLISHFNGINGVYYHSSNFHLDKLDLLKKKKNGKVFDNADIIVMSSRDGPKTDCEYER